MKLWDPTGRGQGVTSLHFAYPFPCFTSTTSFHSLFLHQPQPTSSATLLASRHVPSSRGSSYPSPSCPASPFLLHKITEAAERKRGGGVVPS